jgi:hypothetical protein
MSNIPFNHLKHKAIDDSLLHKSIWKMAHDKSFADKRCEPKETIWSFFKSQLGLFGQPQKTQIAPSNRIPFASQKEKEQHNIGEVKSESGKQYIFLETTIGKPRWHSHEELVTMAKEGKKIPEIAKKKMPGLEEVKEKKGKEDEPVTVVEGNKAGFKIPEKPKDALSENINAKVTEQKEKEKPTLKQLMTTQAEVLKLAEIPEEDIGMYALNSMADGAKLRSYSTEVIKGEMTAEQAAEKVKGDYKKMIEGEKPQNAGEMPSEEKKEGKENLRFFDNEDEANKYAEAHEKEDYGVQYDMKGEHFAVGSGHDIEHFMRKQDGIKWAWGEEKEPTSIEKAKKDIERAKELMKDAPEKAESDSGIKTKADHQKYIDETQAWIDKKEKKVSPEASTEQKDEDKDTLPVLPSEKDVKEGNTKQINGITYELKKGESGELRWHRVTEEEKKEPWQMTRAEYNKQENQGKLDSIISAIKEGKTIQVQTQMRITPLTEPEHIRMTGSGGIQTREGSKWVNLTSVQIDQLAKQSGMKIPSFEEKIYHHAEVKQALEAGKEVPENVLKDYPELKPKESNTITMPRQEAIDEHKNLVKVLESGTEEERKAEAKKQAEELEGYEEGNDEGSPTETLNELVEERLNEKQEKKKFKDVGTRVGGSKKEMAAIRVLTAGDLEKLDNATAYKVVTKERILPDIDAEAEKANGVESGAAYLKKKLRESVNAKPPNTPEDRKLFVELTPKIFEQIDKAKTIEELRQFGYDSFESFMDWGTRKKVTLYKGEKLGDISKLSSKEYLEQINKTGNIDRLLGKEFLNLIGRNSDSAKDHWNNARLLNSFDQETADKEYQNYAEGRKNVIEMNKKRLDEYTPEQWEHYFKTDPTTAMIFNRRQLATEKTNNPEKYQEGIDKYKKREYESNERRNEVLPFEKWLEKRPQYRPREADWTWADPKDKKAIEKRKAELKIHDNPPLEFIKRTNGREVKDSDITPEAIKNKYGFASVQFGHYVEDKEAKEHVRHFIESMNDLEDALGLDIKKINELSGLSIAFGARGSGNAMAHYEPMAKIINLTKTQGDGTVAHEYFHHFDHLLGGMGEGTRKEKVYLSQQTEEVHKRTKEESQSGTPEHSKYKLHIAMQNVLSAMKQGTNEVKVEFRPGEQHYTYGSIRSMYEDKGFEATKEYLMQRYGKDPKELGSAEDYFKYLATLSKKPIDITFPTGKSKYYDGARAFKSKYWQSDIEMFARAAEAYVQDRLVGNGMYNNYLVAGNNIQLPDKSHDSNTLQLIYPQGEERIKINEAFDNLIQAAKDELNIGVDKPKEGKRISSELQMQKSLYNPSFFDKFFQRIK